MLLCHIDNALKACFQGLLLNVFDLKRRLFCYNQRIFVYHLPIKFFYFVDFR